MRVSTAGECSYHVWAGDAELGEQNDQWRYGDGDDAVMQGLELEPYREGTWRRVVTRMLSLHHENISRPPSQGAPS